ncbi:MAG: hypothetical protein E7549_08480 [Ruminococcaceae bacterium]|nr:hypothetical protein [Oscillospiraceae bacterium]
MAKKILSWALACALILTCFSGIALVGAADELPTPYVWYTVDQTTGEVTASRQANTSPLDPYVSTEIPGGNGYGLKLTGDWQGIWIGSDALYGLPEDKSITWLIEYYVEGDKKLNEQLLRIMPAQNFDKNGVEQGGEQWIDYFTEGKNPDAGTDVIELDKTAVMAYTYPAAQLDAIRNKGLAMGIKGCYGGTDCVYIKSMKWVESTYVNYPMGAACYSFEEAELTPYYPGITASVTKDLSYYVQDFINFKVGTDAAAYATDANVNKPVYIKVYTKAGYENTTIPFNQFEAYTPTGRWACDNGYARPSIIVENGVGGVLLPETSFTNANNAGSFRIAQEDVDKMARIEVYDAATYCVSGGTDAALKEIMHNALVETGYGVTKEGAVDFTASTPGQTGTVTCNACGAVISENKATYPAVYSFFDTADGVLTSNRVLGGQGGNAEEGTAGHTNVTQIPGTDEYGIRLEGDWSGFWMGGTMMANIPADQSVTMAVEYYITGDVSGRQQLFRYQSYSGMEWKDMFTDTEKLVGGTSGLFFHTYTAEELAAIGTGDMRFTILGCGPGAERVYIQSMKLINTGFVHPLVTSGDFAKADIAGRPVCDYYPDIIAHENVNTDIRLLEATETFEGYHYIRVYGAVAGNADDTNRTMLAKIYAMPGHENDTVPSDYRLNYDSSKEDGTYQWTDFPAFTFVNGVAEVEFEACLKNRLNSAGSFRVIKSYEDIISHIEIYNVAEEECTHENTTTTTVEATCTTDGSVTVTCDACGEVISTEVIPATGHVNTTTTTVEADCVNDGSITVTCACGEVISTEVIPATGHVNTTTTTVDADCVNDGSITVTCDACGEVISTEVIPALGHKEPTGTWNAKQYCLNDCGTVLYDLEALLNAGGEVTLDRDLVTDKAITVNTAVVLNLAGYSISATELDTVGDGVFYVPAGGDLTINGEGTINGVGGNNYSMAIWANGGKVTINGGTYTNVGAGDDDHYDLIYVKNGGEVVINGGTFIAHTPVWTLNSHDTLKGTFTVNGGKFYKYDPANNITENPTKVWVADGFDTVAEGDYFVLTEHVPVVEIIDGRYYEDGKKVPYAGLVLVDGNYYYVNDNAKVETGRFFASRFNDFTQFTNGYYYFDENGVMNTEPAVIDGYYYGENGKCESYAGLVEVDGDYYYVLKNGEVKLGRYAIVKHNDLKAKGIYSFGTDGKMLMDVVENGYYYTESGLTVGYLGLVEAADGNLYYVQAQGKVVVNNARFLVSNHNGLVTKGYYAFDANGAMIR